MKNLGVAAVNFFQEKNSMQPGKKWLVASRLEHLVNVGTIIKVIKGHFDRKFYSYKITSMLLSLIDNIK